MPEHSHNPYPQQQPAAPWPGSLAASVPPVATPQPQPLPTMQQFQYAGEGYVLPGAPAGQHPPLSATAGTIGTAHGGALAIDTAPTQAWAYPTPQGMRLVQSGAPSFPVAQPMQVAAHVRAVQTRSRLRWETIVPSIAVACFAAAIALFISDFDRITGRTDTPLDHRASAAKTTAADGATDSSLDASDVEGALVEATNLLRKGHFDEAANLLHPMLELAAPDARVVKLHARIDALGERNTALLRRMSQQRRTKQWSGVVATIGQLEKFRPLTPSMVLLRKNALVAARTDRALATARELMAGGRNSAALAVVTRALMQTRDARLVALRKQLIAKLAAPAAVRGGGGQAPPPIRGNNVSTTAQPPADVPKGTLPPRPVRNPVTAGGHDVHDVGVPHIH